MPYSATSQFYPRLLISALREESSVILEQHCHNKEKTPQGYNLFRFQVRDMLLLEIGSGRRMDHNKVESAISQINPGLIINFGICGALNPRIKLNKNYLAKSVCHENEFEIDLLKDLDLLQSLSVSRSLFPRVRLLTVRDPVLDSMKREELRRITACDVVDMEAYFVAHVAQKLEIPIVILKQVSDYADYKAMQQIKQNKRIWQESLLQGLSKIINF